MARSQRQSQKTQPHPLPPSSAGMKSNPASPNALMIQSRPHRFDFGDDQSWDIMLDRVFCIGKHIFVAGWSSLPCSFKMVCNGHCYSVEAVGVYREDVNAHLGIDTHESLGFAFAVSCEDCEQGDIFLEITNMKFDYKNLFPLQVNTLPKNLGDAELAFGSIFSNILSKMDSSSTDWEKLASIAPCKKAPTVFFEGAIEHAVFTSLTKQIFIFGWLPYQDNLKIWACDESGKMYKPEAVYRFPREDVKNHLGIKYDISSEHGVIVVVKDFPTAEHITLKVAYERNIYEFDKVLIANTGCDVKAFASILFGLPISLSDFVSKVDSTFFPLLAPIHFLYKEQFARLSVEICAVGTQLESPKLSIIVPLYGRYDFVDIQLFDFMRDPWILQNCEIIYVIDDAKIQKNCFEHIEVMHRLLGIPVVCVWGGINRGFSGANNLAASVAGAETLLFLNSDVFMNSPGGFEHMYNVLHQDNSIGAVGARLLHADGSIQHAGIALRRRNDLGIWMNDHPYAGCAPELDPLHEPTNVQAVTGACIMIRKSDFILSNRWSEDYFIGDFEDTDLCFSLQKQNLRIVYCPEACFTHLERQSIPRMNASPDFRQKVSLYNAVLHQTRWNFSSSASTGRYLPENQGSAL